MTDPALELVEDNPIGEPWNLKADDVAEYLGISREEVYRIHEQKLPYVKVERRRRYPASDVRAYVEERIQGDAGDAL